MPQSDDTPGTEPSQQTAVVLSNQEKVWLPAPNTPIAACPTSIDLSTPHGRARAINACSPADTKMPKDGEIKLVVTDYLIYPDQVSNRETGELIDCVRTVLFNRQGMTYKTTAPHAVEFVRRTLLMFGQDALKQGIPIIIRRRRGDNDRDYHDLRIDTEALEQ